MLWLSHSFGFTSMGRCQRWSVSATGSLDVCSTTAATAELDLMTPRRWPQMYSTVDRASNLQLNVSVQSSMVVVRTSVTHSFSPVRGSFIVLCTVAMSIKQSMRKLPTLMRISCVHSDVHSFISSVYLHAVTQHTYRSRYLSLENTFDSLAQRAVPRCRLSCTSPSCTPSQPPARLSAMLTLSSFHLISCPICEGSSSP